jgi:hypothetical protein
MGSSASIPSSGISFKEFEAYAKSAEIAVDRVDLKATFDRYKDNESGLIPADTVTQLMIKTDVFLTHEWEIDELDRKNHDRVAMIDKALKSMGIVTWFDSEKMTHELIDQASSRIDNAAVVIVFVTQRYMQKVNGSDANDHCRMEFNYAIQEKTSAKMIPVVMEPQMKDIRNNWTGLVKTELGNILYVDFSNDNDFQSAIQQLKAEILSRTNPLWVLQSESPLEVTINPENTDRLMIDQLSSWFGSIHISSAVARRYAELLVEKKTFSATNLQDKLEENSNFLEDIGGFDEKDISVIKEGLKFLIVDSGDQNIVPADDSPQASPVPSNKKNNLDYTQQKSVPDPTIVPIAGPVNPNELTKSTTAKPEVSKKREPRSHPRISSESHSELISSLSWSPVGNKIASGSYDNTIKIWDGKSLELLKTLTGHSRPVQSVSWNHDGSQIASGSSDSTIQLWDSSTGKTLHTLEDHSSWVRSVAWNHDSTKIVSGSEDTTIKIWSWKKSAVGPEMNWAVLMTLEGHSGYVLSVSWSHDDTKVISGSQDKTIKIWDSSTGKVLKTLNTGDITSASGSHDGSKIVCCSSDKTVRIWNAVTGELLKTLKRRSEVVTGAAWSPDDRSLALCYPKEDKIIIWDSLTGQMVNSILLLSEVQSAAWSLDGNELVCNDGNKIKVYPVDF